jgi:hypothetical protein
MNDSSENPPAEDAEDAETYRLPRLPRADFHCFKASPRDMKAHRYFFTAK